MKKGMIAGLVVGAVIGFVTSSAAFTSFTMAGLYFKQYVRLVPTIQEIYVAGMLDVMGTYRVLHPLRNYRTLVRAEKCIDGKRVNTQQLAQGMAEYGRLNPSAFDIPGLSMPNLTPGFQAYLEFLCPDLFNEAVYKRDGAVIDQYSEWLIKHPDLMRQD
jgi:hypothetical protein